MSDNIKPIRPNITIDTGCKPNKELVECLKWLLSLAKNGSLREIAYVAIEEDFTLYSDYCGESINPHYIVAELENLKLIYREEVFLDQFPND